MRDLLSTVFIRPLQHGLSLTIRMIVIMIVPALCAGIGMRWLGYPVPRVFDLLFYIEELRRVCTALMR